MKLSPRPRKTVSLSDSQHQRLNVYAVAASAAGVGVMALSQPAEAKIVYTATHHLIEKNSPYHLDLNHDGKTDFTLAYGYSRVTSGTIRSVFALAPSGNGVEGVDGSTRFLAAALAKGTRIPNSRRFSQPNALMAYVCDGFIGTCRATTSFKGQWVNATNRYLGLKFKIHGQTHYGWARLSIQYNDFSFTATLTGYAYETVPNKSITAGETKGPDDEQAAPISLNRQNREPRTLGMLALGAPGLSIWRREESVAAEGD
jgi:hypothetical protein